MTDVGALRTMKLHSYLKYSGIKRAWLNTPVGCGKKSGAGLCMVLSELHCFLELLEFVYTLSVFDQKYVSRGAQKCLLYLLRSFHMKRTWVPSVAQTHRGHIYLLVMGSIFKVSFLFYTETLSRICKIKLQIHILSNHFLPELQ